MKNLNLKSVSLLNRNELINTTGGGCWDYYVTRGGVTRVFDSRSVAQAYVDAWNSLGHPCSVEQMRCYSV